MTGAHRERLGPPSAGAAETARFETLLAEAAVEAPTAGGLENALRLYTEAANLARSEHLERAGDAELGRALALRELGRSADAEAALRRARADFRRRGATTHRGCAELLLCELALERGEPERAERHAQLAVDLLTPCPAPRLLAGALTARARVLASEGFDRPAEILLRRAGRLAERIADPELRGALRRSRWAVRALIAEALGLPAPQIATD